MVLDVPSSRSHGHFLLVFSKEVHHSLTLTATFCKMPILYSELWLDHAQPSKLEDHTMWPGNDHVPHVCQTRDPRGLFCGLQPCLKIHVYCKDFKII